MATVASVAVAAALLAGCSTSSQGTSALPGSGSGSSQPMGHSQGHHGNPYSPFMIKGKMSELSELKYQVAGKLPAPAVPRAMKQLLKNYENSKRPALKFHRNSHVGAWAINSDFGYMLGFKANLKKGVTAVDLESNGCGYDPVTVKVDSSSSAWAVCSYNNDFSGSTVQQYSSTGVLQNTYSWSYNGCPYGYYCEFSEAEGFDSGISSNTVYGANTFSEAYYCVEVYYYPCYFVEGTGYVYWPKGSPSSSATQVSLYETLDSGNNYIYEVGYMDADANNNLYFTYDGCESSYPYTCGFGLDEMSNANSPSPGTPVSLLSPGSIGFWGGIYVSNSGATLNVVDQDARTNTQYALPWTGSPVTVLGPTATNLFGFGDPIAGGFNSGGTAMALGDAYGWLDKITVSGDVNKAIASLNCTDGCFGTAYSPSDRTW